MESSGSAPEVGDAELLVPPATTSSIGGWAGEPTSRHHWVQPSGSSSSSCPIAPDAETRSGGASCAGILGFVRADAVSTGVMMRPLTGPDSRTYF